jgi:hypothetical protein
MVTSIWQSITQFPFTGCHRQVLLFIPAYTIASFGHTILITAIVTVTEEQYTIDQDSSLTGILFTEDFCWTVCMQWKHNLTAILN